LSPLIGAWYLKDLDNAMMKLKNVFYIRFADDWLVLTKTHSQLRKAIRIMEKILASLKMLKHPDKTFIGKISKGFDFLGYRLSPTSLGLSDISIERRTAKLVRLYEQGAPKERIVQYWRKWKLAYQLKFDIEYKGKVVEAVFNACGQSYKLIMLGRPQHQTTLS